MDFFKPGSFSILKINSDGSLTEIDSSLTDAAGETLPACDCPPGMCLSEAGADFGFDPADMAMNMIFDIMGAAGPADDEVEEEDPVEDYRADAIAQLGRITEGLAEVASIHARLVAELVGG
jgi:hypothetical protein